MLLRKELTALLISLVFASSATFAGEDEKLDCRELKRFIGPQVVGTIDCSNQYQHYNAKLANSSYSESTSLKSNSVKIASFNVYNLGSTKTEFKDYGLVAKIINNWDVVGAQEISPIIGVDLRHNLTITKFHSDLKTEYDSLVSQNASSPKLKDLKKKIELVRKQYHRPGYINLLEELQKLDPSWSLILSGSEEGSARATIFELAGYFYRGKTVKPVVNEYCSEYFGGKKAFACTPKFSKDFYPINAAELLSRRPFMASFKSGKFDFALLNAHLIHNTPGSEELRAKILKTSFNVDSFKEIGYGVKKITFARFAEAKHMLNFISLFKQKYSEKDVILLGDMNLEIDEKYWDILMQDHQGMKLTVSQKTSISLSRLRGGKETDGVKNNYDHFIYDTSVTTSCSSRGEPKVFNFLKNDFADLIHDKYKIRSHKSFIDPENPKNIKYYYSKFGEQKQSKLVDFYLKSIKEKLSVSRGELVKRYDLEEQKEDYIRKMFAPQLSDRSFYRFYREAVSDHLPIYMNCDNTFDLD